MNSYKWGYKGGGVPELCVPFCVKKDSSIVLSILGSP